MEAAQALVGGGHLALTLQHVDLHGGLVVGGGGEDLDYTEMLRSDFINNFSHEFKTPIVSIAGYCCDYARSGR